MKYSVEIKETKKGIEIAIWNNNPNLIALIILFTLILTSGALFLMVLILWVSNGAPLRLGLIIGLILLGIITYYFSRLFLWNQRGKELLIIEDHQLFQTMSYGLFKDQIQTLQTASLSIRLISGNPKDDDMPENQILDANLQYNLPIGYLRFSDENDRFFITETQLQLNQLREIRKAILDAI